MATLKQSYTDLKGAEPQPRQVVTRPGHMLAPQLDYVLLDGSSSMSDKWFDTMAALDNYTATLKSENIASHGILAQFASSGEYYIFRDTTLDKWPTLTQAPIENLRGGTALYDAIAQMCWELRDLDPSRATIVIVTDGLEQSSRTTTADQAKALLDWCRAKGWQVVFLGADFNNSKQARLLGADENNSIGVQKKLLADAGTMLARKRAHFARTGEDINFSASEKQQFGGYLAAPEVNK